LVDNAQLVVLHRGRNPESGRHRVLWHPTYADFAAFYGFTPWAHWSYHPQIKGKVESGVKYVQRNALAGKRFRSWQHLNTWLVEWATTVADMRVHRTTHEVLQERFAREQFTPLGARRLYTRKRVLHRTMATDCLVAISRSRYSVPVRYMGESVVIRELLGSYEILRQELSSRVTVRSAGTRWCRSRRTTPACCACMGARPRQLVDHDLIQATRPPRMWCCVISAFTR
jgi:hypothetical protein